MPSLNGHLKPCWSLFQMLVLRLRTGACKSVCMYCTQGIHPQPVETAIMDIILGALQYVLCVKKTAG